MGGPKGVPLIDGMVTTRMTEVPGMETVVPLDFTLGLPLVAPGVAQIGKVLVATTPMPDKGTTRAAAKTDTDGSNGFQMGSPVERPTRTLI